MREGAIGRRGVAEAARVVADAKRTGQEGNHRVPHAPIRDGRMHEDQRRPGAGLVVGEAGPLDIQKRHAA
jgi:hypothetical protein